MADLADQSEMANCSCQIITGYELRDDSMSGILDPRTVNPIRVTVSFMPIRIPVNG